MFNGMGNMGNMQGMMKKVQKMQAEMLKMQEELKTRTVETTVGGGALTIVANGKKEIESIKIKPEAIDPDDVEMLQDLIVAAVNEAMGQADQASSDAIGKMTGGLGLGGGLGF